MNNSVCGVSQNKDLETKIFVVYWLICGPMEWIPKLYVQ